MQRTPKATTKLALSNSDFPAFQEHSKAAQQESPVERSRWSKRCVRCLHTGIYRIRKIHIIRKIYTSIWNGPVYLPARHKPQRYQANCLLVWTHIGPPDSTFTWGKAEYFEIERMQLCKQGYFSCVDTHKSVGNSSSTADEQIRNYSIQRCRPPPPTCQCSCLQSLPLTKWQRITSHRVDRQRETIRHERKLYCAAEFLVFL